MKLLVLLLVFSEGACSRCPPAPVKAPSTCGTDEDMERDVAEGEALRIVPDSLEWSDDSECPVTWHREEGDINYTSSEEERIHSHGCALLFLPLSDTDSGCYFARLNVSGECHIFHVPLRVVSHSPLYLPMEVSDSNPRITCPDVVEETCKYTKGVLSWDRNSNLMAGEADRVVRLLGATKADSGLYTCRCTWSHNNMDYISTASLELKLKDKMAYHNIQFIQPGTKELSVHPGYPLSVKCKARCGINVYKRCNVTWQKNNRSVSGMEGYRQMYSRDMDVESKESFFSSTLFINKVQESDLKASFRCRAEGVNIDYRTLTLKPADSLTNLLVAMMCVSAVLVLAITSIKYFAVDLVLFSRRFLPCTKARYDGSQYDVYVVYHSQMETKAMEKVLSKFLYRALPLVLEQKCGYRVFIHGRDDIPGEDRLKQVEGRVMLSRRLMVVLTPGSEVNETLSSSPSSVADVAVDWQIGLHHALLQEMRVILVQLGDMGPQGYTHLSPTLQHLVHKCAPLCWREDSPGATRWNSRFWKRVRYAMPTALAKPSSSVV